MMGTDPVSIGDCRLLPSQEEGQAATRLRSHAHCAATRLLCTALHPSLRPWISQSGCRKSMKKKRERSGALGKLS